MIIRTVLLAVLSLMLASGGALAWGSWGARGNDTGGIIPWSPSAEREALATANEMCRSSSWSLKRARITSIRRVYGDYIAYECVFDGPLRRYGPG